jgi:methyl-accepting chemotaxis protein
MRRQKVLRREDLTAKRLGMGIRGIPAGWNAAAAVVVVFIVYPILRLTSEEWRILLWMATALGVSFISATTLYRERLIRRLGDFLERHFAGQADEQDYRYAFEKIANLPRTEALIGQTLWLVLVPPLMVALSLMTDTFSASSAWIIGISGVSAAILAQVFAFVSFKKFLEPYRALVAKGIPDPEERAARIKHTSVGFKLSASISGLIVVVTFFSVTVGQNRLLNVMEARVTESQKQLLETTQAEAERLLERPGSVLPAQPLVSHYGDAHFLIVDATTGQIVSGDSSAILQSEIQAILDSGEPSGDSASFSTPTTFSWQALPDGQHLLIVSASSQVLGVDKASSTRFIVLVASLAVILGLVAARYLTVDITRPIAHLNAQVAAIASGDLRRGEVLELEDDLGILARGVDRMATGLRETVAGVAASADRVEGCAEAIAGAATEVSQSSTVQGESIREVAVAMEDISRQVRGIHESARSLEKAVEGSSASVEDLNAMGEGLKQSGALLIAKVGLASQAFELIFESIARVVERSELLSQGTQKAAIGIDEIAAALRQVDGNAQETSRLSEAVVNSSGQGRKKVQETIDGIGSIREDTRLLASILNELSGRTDEIGSILNVIHEVTEETNLLALNAAIIAAQAGDQGRAFSVVADEVKALADRVLSSTNEIGGVIEGFQRGAKDAVRALERTVESVQRGVELSAEAGEALETITSAATESGSRMEEVMSAVRLQSDAAAHMVDLMAEMSAGVEAIQSGSREQSQTAQEVVSSNREMSQSAQQVQLATEKQQRAEVEISASVNAVREAVAEISRALNEQSQGIRKMAKLLEQVNEGTHANERSTQHVDRSAHALLQESAALRAGIERFKIP